MSYVRRDKNNSVFQQQADATISQANPVSTTLYTVLDTTRNVKIISIVAVLTWAVTQPTPLEVIVTVDDEAFTFVQANPANGTYYYSHIHAGFANNVQMMSNAWVQESANIPLLEGRSVKVQVRVTWATTQPTPLVCRVKWAKLP